MQADITGILMEYADRADAPLLAAAETGEYAWGVEDDTTPHKVTAVRLPSPVEYSTLSEPRTHRFGSARDNPLASLKQEKGIRNNIIIEVHHCRKLFERIKNKHPRAIHLFQSEATYTGLDPVLQDIYDHVNDNFNHLKYASKYQSHSLNQLRSLEDADDDTVTAGDYVGIVASAARAHYIARNEEFPPMHIDRFRTVAEEEISIGVDPARVDEALTLLRGQGRDTSHTNVDTVKEIVSRFCEENLRDRYGINGVSRLDKDILDDAIARLYERHYECSR